MAIVTERILQSSGLSSSIASLAPLELGVTTDTERPAIGTTVAGPKYIGTEQYISVVTPSPAALPLLRRSNVSCFVDTNAAGAHVNLDITAGAQIAGYSIKVFVSGPDTRYAIVTYGSSLIEYVPAGMSQEFVWDGSKWNKTLMSWADRYEIASYIESMVDETPDAKHAIAKLWDADHTYDIANYPLLVPKLRAIKASAYTGSAFITDHSVTVSGSVITGSGTAWDYVLSALTELYAIRGSYTNFPPINIAGVDYAITNVNPSSHQVTVTGSPATGSQTAIFYINRIAGSTTTARTYKDSGRAILSHDGTIYISGIARRDHLQNHYHLFNWAVTSGGAVGAQLHMYNSLGGGSTSNSTTASDAVQGPITDGLTTPRTGSITEPNSVAAFRTIWVGVIL